MSIRRLLPFLVTALLVPAGAAPASPLPGSAYDTGDGDQAGLNDWQGAAAAGLVKESRDANDDCFVGGVKELAPDAWAFNTSAGGCTPGKSNLRVAFVNPETASSTTFGHFAFLRNDTTGNSFLTFELNQARASWTNATGTTIPCRSDGDVLLSFEVGGSSLTTTLYKWRGTRGGPGCPAGAEGTFVSSGTVPTGRFQAAMNGSATITNFVNVLGNGASFPANAFGEAAVDLPAVLRAMGESPCFGFVQMQVHSRSSSSISSAMIDYTTPVPVYLQSCAATGTTYQDTNGDGVRGAGEPGVGGFEVYADLDDDGTLDDGEPTATSDADGFYRILNMPAGTWRIREAPRAGWHCSGPASCSYSRSFVSGGNSSGNDFGNLGPSTASGTVFDDLDADGIRDGGEPGVGGFTFYADLDDDGTLDAGEPAGTSDPGGAWLITDIPAGTYAIREAPLGGWTCSAPIPCSSSRTFASGSAASGLVFGDYARATLTGTLFEDADGDGAEQTAGDTALTGWQVFVDLDADGTFDLGEPQTTTDASGAYVFTGLVPGTYTVRATTASAAWYCTRPSPCQRTATLTSGASSAAASLGFARTATVSGTTFDDANANAIKDAGEGGLSGFTHWVDYNNDNVHDAGEPGGTSDGSGAWTINGVRAGSWTVRQEPNGAYACTTPSPCTYARTLASGATSAGNQFGDYVSRSVSGVVFNDADADGAAREAGEPGVAGWVVYADSNANSVRDAGEPTSTTNAAGQYNLTGLANGNYRIRVVSQAGWTCAFPAGCLNSGSIGSGQSDAGKDFGVWGPATISGTAFEDADADGAAREAGEGGLAGRMVYLDSNGNASQDAGEPSATTDANGNYAITGLNPGSYVVRQVLPAGWTCSRPSPCSYAVTTSAGSLSGRDFGSDAAGSIAGVVFEDRDADGAQDAGEAGIAARTVYVDANGNGLRDGGEPSATTTGTGAYTLAALAPGTYTVRQVLPAGWTQSLPAAAYTVTVTSQGAPAGRDFGSFSTAGIGGRLFDDSDFDGSVYEGGDMLRAGDTVYADLDADGARDAGEPAATSDVLGNYALLGLPPGTYVIRADLPAGRACSYPATCAYTVTVGSRDASGGNDFGSYTGATINGSVFEDADADGAPIEPDERGLEGQRVYLDADDDGVRDSGEPTALTGPSGDFSLTGLTARTWHVRLDLGSGWSCDSPAPCRADLTLGSGDVDATTTFGIHTTGTISGHLFTDRDDDGGPQVWGENDQPGRTVELDGGAATATTDDNGNYRFTGVAPGVHHVRQVLPDGWTCSTPDPCSWDVTLGSGQDITGKDFSSWTTASFSGTYFEDSDADGDFPEAGEPALAGRTVYLDLDDSGSRTAGEPTTTTSADGSFGFQDLAPGTYAVRAAGQPAGWTCSYPSPCADTITLEAAEHAQDVDFGAWTSGTVSGRVLHGEAGLEGWTVYADLDDDGALDDGEPSTTTAADGGYELTLDPGSYKLRTSGRSGWTCTSPAGCTQELTMTSGGALTDRNFALQTTALAGTVYEDGDGDLTRGDGEHGVADVTVFVDLGDDGSLDSGDPVTTTGADGSYRFDGVEAGDHAVRAQAPDGWRCGTADCRLPVSLAAGDDLSGRDIALNRPASIAGTTFEDVDADGAPPASGDAGVGGWTVYLDLDRSGTREDGEPQATTDANGHYRFADLEPGTYTVREVAQDSLTCSYPSPCSWEITVASGDDSGDRDFGNWRPAGISGRVTDASNGDGLGGETVYLDSDDDGTLDGGESQQTTADDGSYAFTGIRPGTHVVRYQARSGRSCVAPQPCRRAPQPRSGQTTAGQDFSSRATASVQPPQEPAPPAAPAPTPTPAPTELTGTLFEDLDADGAAREATDPALAGWTVTVDDGPMATTDAQGRYHFTGLEPGEHVLRVVMASDRWVCSLPVACVRHVTLAAGGNVDRQDFAAWRKAKVTGHEFEDRDHDGSAIEPGDRPLVGWRVYADLDRDGRLDANEPSDLTDATGRYGLTNLPLGAFTVREVAPRRSPYRCTFPATCAARVALRSGVEDETADFGAVAGIRRAARHSRIQTPAACRSARFSVRVHAQLARAVQLRVDGRRRTTISRNHAGSYRFALDARRYSPGVHHVLVRITFLDRSAKTVRATFYRCMAARPQYTG